VSRAVPQESQQRTHHDGSPAGVGLPNLTASPDRIEFMDMHQDAIPLSKPLRETDVIGVAMSQHDAPNMIKRVAQLSQFLIQLTPVAGQSSVNDHDPRSILNQVSVDDIGTDAMQTRTSLIGSSPLILRIATAKPATLILDHECVQGRRCYIPASTSDTKSGLVSTTS
jgi:hypothetical protein